MWNCNNPYADRDASLKRLGFRSYREYLRSDLWKTIRQRAIQAAKRRCFRCGSLANIQVHHRAYDPRTLAGADLGALTVVCKSCHSAAERPFDRTRTRHDRFVQSSEYICETKPQYEESVERWWRRNRRWMTEIGSVEEAIALVAEYRQRATQLDAGRKCILCRSNLRTHREPKGLREVPYGFCKEHPWGHIRACLNGLALYRKHVAAA